jgi:hypothetical protein
MKTILEILLEDYYLCVTRFPLNTPEYKFLQNGIQVRNDRGQQVIHVLCDAAMLAAIRQLFAEFCPESAARLREIPEY